MTLDAAASESIRRLVPAVLQYSSDQFNLGQDLDRLDKVRRANAPEATIFYSARILEALAANALQAAGLLASTSVLSNLVLLQQFNLIPVTTRYWAHSLRRVGNSVRHIHGHIGHEEAELALKFVEYVLKWFFCNFRFGCRLPTITLHQKPIWQEVCPEIDRLMESFDGANFDPMSIFRQLQTGQHAPLLRIPALCAVLVEMLLDRKQFIAAKDVLDRGLAAFPEDLRLRQLMGLLSSRTGNLTTALEYLLPLYEKFSDDDETAGIMAGTYKRLWQHDRTNRAWLAKSHGAYRSCWERSRYSNVWLGINVASCALWLGHPSESRETAQIVRDLLRGRATAVHAQPELALDYWDRVTLAEAELLLGNLSIARGLYREAFDQFVLQESSLEVSRAQLGENLPWLGISVSPEQYLERRRLEFSAPILVMGVMGDPDQSGNEQLREQIGKALEHLLHVRRNGQQPNLVVLTALAEETDQLVAELALSAPVNGTLRVVLPLELADYYQVFRSAEAVVKFRCLLNQADCIVFPSSQEGVVRARDNRPADLEAALERCGKYIVDHCDVLVGIWDGVLVNGRGSTGELARYVREKNKPLLWVKTSPPYGIFTERFEEFGLQF